MTATETAHTISILRILKAPPERVYRALTNPAAKVRWEPPFGFIGEVQEWDLRVGARYRMSFTNFSTGTNHSFGGEILELVENERLVVSDAFDDPNLGGTMRTFFALRPVLNGTELRIEQTGIPAAIPLEFCYAGWQESLVQLAQLVEPEIPDAPADESQRCGSVDPAATREDRE